MGLRWRAPALFKSFTIVACVSAAVLAYVPMATASTLPALWPAPEAATRGDATAVLGLPAARTGLDVKLQSWSNPDGPGAQIVQDGFTRFLDALYGASEAERPREVVASARMAAVVAVSGQLSGVDVSVSDESDELGPDTNETYNLDIPQQATSRAQIHAATPYGVLHALSTLAQLIEGGSAGVRTLPGVPVSIKDAPRFPHRGLLIDTARHFLSVSTILSVIDGLEQNKLNVLHWHITDAESFPLEIAAFPEMADAGAYDSDKKYSAADVSQVVSYAKARGVRVIPELDTPGHSYAWGLGFSNLTASCPAYPYAANINNIPLDPTSDFTWTVLSAIVAQLAEQFPDAMVHAGGDEVITACWQDDPAIATWMQQKGWGSDYTKLLGFHVNKLGGLLRGRNRTVVQWIEVFDAGVDVSPDTVFQVWKSKADLLAVIKAGYRAILSDSDAWYLNCGFNPSCAYSSWQTVYNNEPITGNPTPAQEALVLGGEAALWSEFANDANVGAQLWPRLSAAAERLWSPRSVNNATDAQPRLDYHSCRMRLRGGLASGPIGPGFCEADLF